MNTILITYIIAINVISFTAYGIDKWKARRNKWRIPESRLLWIAALGGALGAWGGMYLFHHKTQHLKFKYGIPGILVLLLAIIGYFLISTKS